MKNNNEKALEYLTFHMIKTRLQFDFTARVVNGITYYLDKNNTVVATEEKDMLNLYFDCQDTVWSHNGIAVMGIVKDFKLINYRLQKDRNSQLADIAVVTGLCGAVNKLVQLDKHIIIEECDEVLEFNPDKDIRDIEMNGLPAWFSAKEVNRQLTNLRNLKKELMEAKAKFEIGSLSTIDKAIANNGSEVLRFKVSDLIISIDSRMTFDEKNGIRYNILKGSLGRKANIPQHATYQYHRKHDDWYWEAGYNTTGSNETRKNIEELCDCNYHRAQPARVAKLTGISL